MAKAKLITDLDAQGSVLENARIIALTRLDEFYSWEQYVDSAYSVHELHNLRIAAKRLRYTLELFADSFASDVAPLVAEITQLQDELGSLHDHDVMIALLRLTIGALDAGPGYIEALTNASSQQSKHTFVVDPQLLAALLHPTTLPSASPRQGLERLLNDLGEQRSNLYTAFQQHWYRLRESAFRDKVISMLK
jgi:CHAD domain-containing protein